MLDKSLYVHDITAAIKAGELPECALQRPEGTVWHIRAVPFGEESEGRTTFRTTVDGDFVRIPLLPYLAGGDTFEDIAAALVKLGADCSDEAKGYTGLCLVLGKPIETIEGGFRVWFGSAYQRK